MDFSSDDLEIIGTPPDASRPLLDNRDGTFSTERTISFEEDGRHYLIPTIVGGKPLEDLAAIDQWRAGKNPEVGVYRSMDEASRAAVKRSEEIGRRRLPLEQAGQPDGFSSEDLEVIAPAAPATAKAPDSDRPRVTEHIPAGDEFMQAPAVEPEAPTPRRKTGSVIDLLPDAPRQGPPVRPEISRAMEAAAIQNPALAQRTDWRGQSARVNAPATAARVQLLYDEAIKKGATPEAARRWAESNAVTADASVAAPSNFDFDTAAEYRDANVLSRAGNKTVTTAKQQAGGLVEAALDLAGADSSSARQLNETYQRTLEALGEGRRGATYLEQQLEGALTSIGTQGPQMLYAVLGGPAAATVGLGAMFAQVAGQEYTQGRQAGLKQGDALERAAFMGTAEVVGERFALPGAKRFADALLKSGIPTKELVPRFAAYLAKENVGEQITTGMQFGYDALAAAGLKPGSTVEDYLRAVGDTAVQTTIQTLLTGAGGRALQIATGEAADARAQEAAAQGADDARAAALAKWGDFNALLALSPKGPTESPAIAAEPQPLEFERPDVAAMKAENLTAAPGVAPAPVGNEIDFEGLDPAARAVAIEQAQAAELARQQDAATRIEPQAIDLAQEKAANMALAPSPAPTDPSAVNMDAFLREQALKRGDALSLVPRPERPAEAEYASRAVETAADMRAAVDRAAAISEEAGTLHRARNVGGQWVVVREGEAAPTPAPGASAASAAAAVESAPPIATTPASSQADTVDAAAHEAATSPTNDKVATKDQILGGNAALGHPKLAGMDLSIENPAGSVRRDLKNDPPKWETRMQDHYGYVKGTIGFDKDHLDIFLQPGTSQDYSGPVFVVDQNNERGGFDEHKVIAGPDVRTVADAKAAYLRNYNAGWPESRIRGITEMPMEAFKTWAFDKSQAGPRGGPLSTAMASTSDEAVASTDLEPMPTREEDAKRRTERLLQVEGEIGWAERGGHLIRATDTGGEKPEVVGRTKWVAKSDFWPGRPKGIMEGEARSALRKLAAGEPLGKREQRFIEYADKWLTEQERATDWHPTDDELAAEGLKPQDAADAALVARLAAVDDSKLEALAVQYESDDAAFIQAVKDHLNELDQQSAAARERGAQDRAAQGEVSPAAKPAAEDTRRPALGEGAKPSDPKPPLRLEGETEAQIRAREASEAKAAEAKKKREAAPEPAGFMLTGSDRPADEARARGQMELVADRRGPSEPKKDQPAPAGDRAKEKREARTAAEPARNEDVGENLWYNRRNFTGKALSWDQVKDLNDALKVKEVVKSKVWPRPDYEQLVADGLPALFARMVKQVYDGIAVAPGGKTDAALERYIATVTRVREELFAWIKDDATRRAFTAAVEEAATARDRLKAREFGSSFLARLWPEEMAKNQYERFGRGSKAVDELLQIGGNRAFKALQFTMSDLTAAQKEVAEGWPAKQEAWERQGFQVVPTTQATISEGARYEREGGRTVVWQLLTAAGWKGSSISSHKSREAAESAKAALKPFMLLDKRGRLLSQHETEDAAKAAAREKVKREAKGGDLRGMNIEAAQRRGPARRATDEDVTSERLMREFGFRGVNFGREGWINQAERQAYLNHAYDGLLDLAEILEVPPKALSLDGMLGIAFGAQGRGGNAAAHFVPGVNEINLTKTMGAGTLAHEWGHALDHYFAVQAGLAKTQSPFLSEVARDPTGDIRPEMVEAFKAVVGAMKKRNLTPAEIEERRAAAEASAKKNLDRWIDSLRAPIASKDAHQVAEFDQLADRLRAGDMGEGFVKSGNKQFAPVVAAMRNLMKDVTGRVPSVETTNAIESWAASVEFYQAGKEAKTDHVAQRATTYANESTAADRGKGGKEYWATHREMFARAFELYVADRLSDVAQDNTFLSDAQHRAAAKNMSGEGFAYPYPRGEERTAINKAMDQLVGAIDTRKTERGVAMFARFDMQPSRANQLPVFFNAEVSLGRPRLAETQSAKAGIQRVAFDILDTAIFKANVKEVGRERAMARAKVGDVLLLMRGSEFAGLENIEIFESRRGHGYGEKVVRSMLESQDAPVRIIDIQPKAVDFWVKMGAKFPRSQDYMEASLDRFQYATYQRQHGRSLRENDAQGEASLRGEDARRGEADEAPSERRQRRDPADGPGFYRGQGALARRPGLSARSLRQALAAVIEGSRVPVRVVQSVTNLPFEAPDDTKGVYYRGRIWAVADNIADPLDAERTIARHEVTHAGMDIVYGGRSQRAAALRSIQLKNAKVRELASAWRIQYGAEFIDKAVAQGMEESEAARAMLVESMEEGLAYFSMDAGNTVNGWKSFVAEIQKGLRALGLNRLADWLEGATNAEVLAFLDSLRRATKESQAGTERMEPVFARRSETPPWYSELARQVEGIKTESAPAAQWAGTLRGLKGVKSDELEWSGVLDWLATREGKVRRDELTAFLEQNGVKVEEVMLGEGETGSARQAMNDMDRVRGELDALGYDLETDDFNNLALTVVERRTEQEYLALDNGERDDASKTFDDLPENVQALVERWDTAASYGRDDISRHRADSTRFSQYTLPGGENYRELLLTLPFKRELPAGMYLREVPKNPPQSRWIVADKQEGESYHRYASGPTQEAAIEKFHGYGHGGTFKSTHFDTPNILAHVRFNERTDAEGRRVLFIEEIQSDWAQKGKREGFKDLGDEYFLRRPDGDIGRDFASREEGEQYLRDHPGAGSLDRAHRDGVPRAPFVGKTEAWVALAVKRMIRYAAEHGFDRVAFTAGEQQADRYDLSRYVEEVHARARDAGDGRKLFDVHVYAKGRGALTERRGFDRRTPEELAELVGKDLADKIISQQSGKWIDYRGLDLKVGGEGMIVFYNKIVPNVVNDLLKKLGGGRVGRVMLSMQPKDKIAMPTGSEVLSILGDPMTQDEFLDLPSAERKALTEQARQKMAAGTPQPGFDVTPAMRERVMGGSPMFARTSFSEPLDFPGVSAPGGAAKPGASPPASGTATAKGAPPVAGTPPPRGNAPTPPPGGTAGRGATPPASNPWAAGDPTRLENLRYVLQDKHIDTRAVLKAIHQAQGQVSDQTDPYLQEELFHGRAAKGVTDFLEHELKPLLRDMAARGVKIADFEEWLHARHAEERNVQIEKINPTMRNGSGMDTAVARQILADARASGKAQAYTVLAARVDAINATTRRALVAYGLEAPSTIAAWGVAYKNYVPLQREDMDGGMGTGQGFSVRGGQKRATGSTRAVVDILANIAMARERAIVRGEKNRVANALIGLATANPNPNFWRVDQPPRITRVDERTGLVVSQVDPLYKSRENVLMARIPDAAGNIIEHAVVFNEHDERASRMAKSLKNLDVDQLLYGLGTAAKFTRWFASMNTQWNPVFGIVNITRDSQSVMLNLSATPIAGKQIEVASHALSALRGIYSDLRDTRAGRQPTSAWAQLWEEFQREGGRTGYRDLFATSADRAKALQEEIDLHTQGQIKTAPKKTLNAVLGWLSDYNDSMENAWRLAAYKAAIDQGLTKQRAASIAKNISVNFNRKGAVTSQAAALYAFFNASMQGTTRTLETLAGPKGVQIIAGGVLLGVLQAVALAVAGFDEDDPPEFVREKALVIPIGGKHYLTIPMAQGFLVLPNIGRLATEYVLGGFRGGGEKVVNLLGILVGASLPVGASSTVLQTLTPTAIDPLAALAENKDWTGKPIAREDFNKLHPTPGHTRAKDTASKFSKVMSQAINAASGGTAYKPGVFSPTPDQIDYLIAQFTGGVGRELMKAEQTVMSGFTGEKLPPYKIPLVGRFYGNADNPASAAGRFYRNLEDINRHGAEIKGREKAGESVRGYLRENPEARLAAQARAVERKVQELRRQKRKMQESGAPKARITAVEEDIARRQTRFNEAVSAARRQESPGKK